MTALALIGGLVGLAALLAGAVAWLAYRNGRAAGQRTHDIGTIEVKDAQLEIAVRRPGTRAELAERLRDGDF